MRQRSHRLGRLFMLAVVIAGAVVVLRYLASEAVLPFQGQAVGVVEVRGVIRDAEDVVAALKRFRTSERIGAVVLRVDSPGGAVAPAQEIYSEVARLGETKSVVASLGSMAASGGYYVASASHSIVANPGTLTGSIGVIMAVRSVEELAHRAGIKETVVKSGPYKDMANPLRSLEPEEEAILQGAVNDVHAQFVAAVAAGRHMTEEDVRKLADGRLYSGAQALEIGLVDYLGSYEEALRIAADAAGIEGEPRTIRARTERWPWWADLLGRVVGVRVSDWLSGGMPGGLLFLYPGGDIDFR